METLLALALGLLVGLLAGGVGGLYWSARTVGRAVRRELDAGRIDRVLAERLIDFRNVT